MSDPNTSLVVDDEKTHHQQNNNNNHPSSTSASRPSRPVAQKEDSLILSKDVIDETDELNNNNKNSINNNITTNNNNFNNNSDNNNNNNNNSSSSPQTNDITSSSAASAADTSSSSSDDKKSPHSAKRFLSVKLLLCTGFMIWLFVFSNGPVNIMRSRAEDAFHRVFDVLAHQAAANIVNHIDSDLRNDAVEAMTSLRNYTRLENISSPFDMNINMDQFVDHLAMAAEKSASFDGEILYRSGSDGSFAQVTSSTLFHYDGVNNHQTSSEKVKIIRVCRSYSGFFNSSSSSSSSFAVNNNKKKKQETDIPFDCVVRAFSRSTLKQIPSPSHSTLSSLLPTSDSFVDGKMWNISKQVANHHSGVNTALSYVPPQHGVNSSVDHHHAGGIQLNMLVHIFTLNTDLSVGLLIVGEITSDRLRDVLFNALPEAPYARAFLLDYQERVIVSSHDSTFTLVSRTADQISRNVVYENCYVSPADHSVMACLYNVSTHPQYSYLLLPLEISNHTLSHHDSDGETFTQVLTDDTNLGNAGAGRQFFVLQRTIELLPSSSSSSSTSSQQNQKKKSTPTTFHLRVFIPFDFYTLELMITAMMSMALSISLPLVAAFFAFFLLQAVSLRMTLIAEQMMNPFSKEQVAKSHRRQQMKRERQKSYRSLMKERKYLLLQNFDDEKNENIGDEEAAADAAADQVVPSSTEQPRTPDEKTKATKLRLKEIDKELQRISYEEEHDYFLIESTSFSEIMKQNKKAEEVSKNKKKNTKKGNNDKNSTVSPSTVALVKDQDDNNNNNEHDESNISDSKNHKNKDQHIVGDDNLLEEENDENGENDDESDEEDSTPKKSTFAAMCYAVFGPAINFLLPELYELAEVERAFSDFRDVILLLRGFIGEKAVKRNRQQHTILLAAQSLVDAQKSIAGNEKSRREGLVGEDEDDIHNDNTRYATTVSSKNFLFESANSLPDDARSLGSANSLGSSNKASILEAFVRREVDLLMRKEHQQHECSNATTTTTKNGSSGSGGGKNTGSASGSRPNSLEDIHSSGDTNNNNSQQQIASFDSLAVDNNNINTNMVMSANTSEQNKDLLVGAQLSASLDNRRKQLHLLKEIKRGALLDENKSSAKKNKNNTITVDSDDNNDEDDNSMNSGYTTEVSNSDFEDDDNNDAPLRGLKRSNSSSNTLGANNKRDQVVEDLISSAAHSTIGNDRSSVHGSNVMDDMADPNNTDRTTGKRRPSDAPYDPFYDHQHPTQTRFCDASPDSSSVKDYTKIIDGDPAAGDDDTTSHHHRQSSTQKSVTVPFVAPSSNPVNDNNSLRSSSSSTSKSPPQSTNRQSTSILVVRAAADIDAQPATSQKRKGGISKRVCFATTDGKNDDDSDEIIQAATKATDEGHNTDNAAATGNTNSENNSNSEHQQGSSQDKKKENNNNDKGSPSLSAASANSKQQKVLKPKSSSARLVKNALSRSSGKKSSSSAFTDAANNQLGDFFSDKMLVCVLNLRGTHNMIDDGFMLETTFMKSLIDQQRHSMMMMAYNNQQKNTTTSNNIITNINKNTSLLLDRKSKEFSTKLKALSGDLVLKRFTAIVERLSLVIESCGANLVEYRGDHFFICLKISKRLPSRLGRRFVGKLVQLADFISALDRRLNLEFNSAVRILQQKFVAATLRAINNKDNNNNNNNIDLRGSYSSGGGSSLDSLPGEEEDYSSGGSFTTGSSSSGGSSRSQLERDIRALILSENISDITNSSSSGQQQEDQQSMSIKLASSLSGDLNEKNSSKKQHRGNAFIQNPRHSNPISAIISNPENPFEYSFPPETIKRLTDEIENYHQNNSHLNSSSFLSVNPSSTASNSAIVGRQTPPPPHHNSGSGSHHTASEQQQQIFSSETLLTGGSIKTEKHQVNNNNDNNSTEAASIMISTDQMSTSSATSSKKLVNKHNSSSSSSSSHKQRIIRFKDVAPSIFSLSEANFASCRNQKVEDDGSSFAIRFSPNDVALSSNNLINLTPITMIASNSSGNNNSKNLRQEQITTSSSSPNATNDSNNNNTVINSRFSSSVILSGGFSTGGARSLYMFSDGGTIARPTTFFGPCFAEALDAERRTQEHLSQLSCNIAKMAKQRGQIVSEIAKLLSTSSKNTSSSSTAGNATATNNNHHHNAAATNNLLLMNSDEIAANNSSNKSNDITHNKNGDNNDNDSSSSLLLSKANNDNNNAAGTSVSSLMSRKSQLDKQLLTLKLLQLLPFAFSMYSHTTERTLDVNCRTIGDFIAADRDNDHHQDANNKNNSNSSSSMKNKRKASIKNLPRASSAVQPAKLFGRSLDLRLKRIVPSRLQDGCDDEDETNVDPFADGLRSGEFGSVIGKSTSGPTAAPADNSSDEVLLNEKNSTMPPLSNTHQNEKSKPIVSSSNSSSKTKSKSNKNNTEKQSLAASPLLVSSKNKKKYVVEESLFDD